MTTAPVVLIKEGIYGSAALMSTLRAWLLTMKWPGDIKNCPRQYLITISPETGWPNPPTIGEAPNHQITVELLDHRMQGKRFSGMDVCDNTIDTYPTPTVVLRFAATDAQTRALARSLTARCLDGTLYPGDPGHTDWQTRAVWLAVCRATLDCIKNGRHEAEGA